MVTITLSSSLYSTAHQAYCVVWTQRMISCRLSHVSNQEEEIERRATEQDTVINMYTLSHTYPPSLLLLLLAAHHHGYSLFTPS